MNVIATLQSIDFKVAATAKSCGKVKVSHAAVKSFDRRGVSCKNARTLYSNTVIGTLAVDGWAVTFGTARRGLGGLVSQLHIV